MDVLLDQHKISEQQQHYLVLEKIIESAIFLLQKGLAFQGHTDQTGNLYELLEMRVKDVPMLISLIIKCVRRKIADQINRELFIGVFKPLRSEDWISFFMLV